MSNKKILINLTEDWFFKSHFLSRAVDAKNSGYDVFITCNESNNRKFIEQRGIKFISSSLNRRSINPFYELYVLIKYFFIIKKINPDIVHNVGPKPIIYGSIAARINNIKSVINAPIGMGFVFSSESIKAKFLKLILLFLLKHTLNTHHGKDKKNRVIFENSDDMNFFLKRKIVKFNDSVLIRGAGVEIDLSSLNF